MTFGIRQADKYALALLDALFNEDELACSCYAMTKRSKKPPLQNDKVALLEGMFIPGCIKFWLFFFCENVLTVAFLIQAECLIPYQHVIINVITT